MFLVMVDARSKWPEVFLMTQTTASKTIALLRQTFAAYGLPDQVVTDNGPQFTSDEFGSFLKSQGIKHVRSAPYHPASNGLAERFVQSLKQALNASKDDGRSLEHRLHDYLLTYRSTPHATTAVSPASLFLHRSLRTTFDLLRPNTESRVLGRQASQKVDHDKRAKVRDFSVGQAVLARRFQSGHDWVPAQVVEVLGPVTYSVETQDGQIWKRHADQLKEIPEPASHFSEFPNEPEESPYVPQDTTSSEMRDVGDPGTPHLAEAEQSPPPMSNSPFIESSPTLTTSHRRYPLRTRHPPDRFE